MAETMYNILGSLVGSLIIGLIVGMGIRFTTQGYFGWGFFAALTVAMTIMQPTAAIIYYFVMLAPGMINGLINKENGNGFWKHFAIAFYLPLLGWLVMAFTIFMNKRYSSTVTNSSRSY